MEPAYVASPEGQLGGCADQLGMCDTLPCLQSPSKVPVLLTMLSGEIDLRLKSYLIVKISS